MGKKDAGKCWDYIYKIIDLVFINNFKCYIILGFLPPPLPPYDKKLISCIHNEFITLRVWNNSEIIKRWINITACKYYGDSIIFCLLVIIFLTLNPTGISNLLWFLE